MQQEKALINAKPYFGVWVGTYFWVSGDAFYGDWEKNPISNECRNRLNAWVKYKYRNVEHRHIKIIEKPPVFADPLNQMGSIAIKCLIWGRAYVVMRHFKKGIKRYKKSRSAGRIKRRRIDK